MSDTSTLYGVRREQQLELINDDLCDLLMEAHWYAKDPKDREALKRRLGRVIDKLRAWQEETPRQVTITPTSEPVTWTINGEPLYAHQLPPEDTSDER